MTIVERINEAVIQKIQAEWLWKRQVQVGQLLSIKVTLCSSAEESKLCWPVQPAHMAEAQKRVSQEPAK